MANISKKTKNMALLGVLTGLIILLGLTPLGMIPLGFIYVTILCIPVIIGTLYMGWKYGIVLGIAFAGVSIYSAFTKPSSLVGTLMGASPVLVIIMCLLPRLLIPVVAWSVYQKMKKNRKEGIAAAVGAVCGSLTNTVFYLGLMLLFYVLAGIDTAKVLGLIGGTGLIAGSSEAAVAGILCPPILMAVKKIK